MSDLTTDLPVGFERADGGITNWHGTRTLPDQIKVTSSGGEGIENLPIEEDADSPQIERAEQATFTHRWHLEWNEAVRRLSGLGRGTVRQGTYLGLPLLFRVLSSSVQREKGGRATLSVVEESMSFDSPPDRFAIAPVELGLNIMKHPRYFYALLGDDGYGSATEQLNQMVIRILQDYFDNPDANIRTAYHKMIQSSMNNLGSVGDIYPKPAWDPKDGWKYKAEDKITGTNKAKRAAQEIIQKFWRGEETPYIIGWQITWSVYYFWPQPLNPGGYIEDPIFQATPALPAYFWSPYFPPRTKPPTVFDWMAYVNPQCYSNTGYSNGKVEISWLRKADNYDYERTWFRVDRTWIGTPVGYWDPDLYNRSSRPQVADDYREINYDGKTA